MSATDSDNSIDWLASDNEDYDSERESDCSGTHGRAEPPPSPDAPPTRLGLPRREVREGERDRSEVRDASSRGAAPSSCGGTLGRDDRCKTGGQTTGRHTLKRHCSLTDAEQKERPLVSEKDLLFTRKCMELQGYIHPLSSILNGLRSGRYRERLSSFQESVAMDRIQRIMGVLQNPCMGEKYISIILKMEEMLKSWFPHVKLQDQPAVAHTDETVPTKKPKLTPVTPTAAASDAPAATKALRVTDLTPPAAYSASNVKWLHTSPICSPTAEQAQAGPPTDRDLMQDNAVSSSTDSRSQTDSVPRGPPLGKINAPCLERLLKSTESIITRKGGAALTDASWS